MRSSLSRFPLVPLLASLAVFCCSGCGGTAEGSAPRNVILICLDTVRADHLGCYGYTRHATTPAIDALADRSLVFTRASATAGWTKPSVPSFLTGTFPMQHGVYEGSAHDAAGARSDVLPEASLTLAEAFRQAGYQTAAFVKNAQLRKGLGFEQGFDLYRDEAGDAQQIRWRARDFLDEYTGERPFFLYLHFLDAHWPYPVPEEYATLFTEAESIELFRTKDWSALRDRINDGEIELSAEQRDALIALYDGSLRYIDDQLSLLFLDLDRRGLADDTVVCIIADHGEEFLEHGRIGHGHGLFENLLHVPWILHSPGAEPQRVDSPVSLVDLFPTLLHAAGLAERGDGPGVDRLETPGAHGQILAEHKSKRSYQQSVLVGERKLIRRAALTAVAPKRQDPLDVPTVFAVGDPVKLELEGIESGVLVADSIRVDKDPSSYSIELRAKVTDLSDDRFRLAGLPVVLSPDYRVYGVTESSDGELLTLTDGLPVKVKGSVSKDGVLIARRVKFYEADADFTPELRGTIGTVRVEGGRCVLEVGGIPLLLAEDAEVEAPDGGRPRLERGDIVRLIESWSPGSTPEGFEVSRELYDLTKDQGEQSPLNELEEIGRLEQLLARTGQALLGLRSWSDADRATLAEEDLEALRAIGYTH